jgi:hypothetical protein
VDTSDLSFAKDFEDLTTNSSDSDDEYAWLLQLATAFMDDLADTEASLWVLYLHIPNIGYKGRDLLLHINTYTTAHLFEKNIQVGRIIFL